jgi:hypothetical protein
MPYCFGLRLGIKYLPQAYPIMTWCSCAYVDWAATKRLGKSTSALRCADLSSAQMVGYIMRQSLNRL